MTDRELMQQALDALKLIDDAMSFPVAKLAIKNLRERLAKPERVAKKHEPKIDLGKYAGTYGGYTITQTGVGIGKRAEEAYEAAKERGWVGVSDDRLMKMVEQVTWRNAAIRVGEDLCSVGPFGYYDMTAQQWLDWALSVVTVHAPPPQRTWVSLTDEEVGDLSDFAYANDEEFVRNVEKYLKEKNNG